MIKKYVIIAGIGMGNNSLMTEQVRQDIIKAQVIIGAGRMLQAAEESLGQSVSFNENCLQQPDSEEQRKYFVKNYHPDEIAERIFKGKEQYYCVLMSGDSGFYSGTKKLVECLNRQDQNTREENTVEIQIHPGISSLSYLCAVFGKDYNDISVASMHGRDENIAYRVKTNRLTFLLTDGSASDIAAHLCEYGLSDVMLYVGCQLSYEDEILFSCRAGEYETYKSRENGLLSVLIENENVTNPTRALKDSDFIRGNVPMTKAEIRYQIDALLETCENGIIYDIGAGTGGVTMELARKIPKGKIYAVECNHEGIELIEKNKRKFAMDQVEPVEGKAPEILKELPAANAIFIGGSKGNLVKILKTCKRKKAQDKMPVVISAITMETWEELLALINSTDPLLEDVKMMQLQISHMVPLGTYHRLEPANPIWLAKGYL